MQGSCKLHRVIILLLSMSFDCFGRFFSNNLCNRVNHQFSILFSGSLKPKCYVGCLLYKGKFIFNITLLYKGKFIFNITLKQKDPWKLNLNDFRYFLVSLTLSSHEIIHSHNQFIYKFILIFSLHISLEIRDLWKI